MGAIKIVIPIEVRGLNAVDRLRQQIALLEAKIFKEQGLCQHDMRLLVALPSLQESLVKGVYFLSEYPQDIKVKCLKCSYEVRFEYSAGKLLPMCPRCLGSLKWLYQPGDFFPAGSWANSFPNTPTRYDCTECGLKYVWPELFVDMG